ncbi:unnamed protein product [Peronospora farinosa]|uniref:Protein kinase domain-containing protein n=1 Tax=Peronospora farinosa TaxID=134698 RepID=A0AAV0SR27_9STRA|nr:unnamed protein product [Peronospora farinosa]
MQSSTPLYAYIFTIRLLATTARTKHGLYDTETQKLTRGMEKLALEPMGDAAVYDLVSLPLTSSKTILRTNTIFRPNDDSATGRGGLVVQVRNRLDRQLYAVKKVKLDPDDKTMKKKICVK